MMNEARLKYIFYFFSAFLLVVMLFLSKNAGISCDEVLHYNQSVFVYNYFASQGQDKSALNTPVTDLKYYGQSYDDITTILIKWFNIEDVYGFRHLMSIIAGWLVFFITALFAIWLTDYKTGILVLILFAVSPTFMGHAQNNLKDIPFALAYIAGVFYMLKFLFSEQKYSYWNLILLTASITFSISLRAGGLLLICYLYFFFFLFYLFEYFKEGNIGFIEFRNKFFLICGISVISWFLSILLWPYALQSPIKNVIESYRVMAHYPLTFRQIFEGKVEWSDYMPWYYLPKSMAITIPIVVSSGFVLFLIFIKSKLNRNNLIKYLLILFTIFFPVIFVIYEKSNIYSSWRQFLFLYPGIVLLASIGYRNLHDFVRVKYLKWGLVIILVLLSIHPVKFMLNNPEFYYLYYNQLVGGLKGAYSNYETDYYYVSQTAASEWLIDYLKTKKPDEKVKVKATYSVEWQFRKHPEIETSYFRYEERSLSDWDYAIVTNRYIPPFQLKKKIWPQKDAIHLIYADDVPVCAIIERKTKDDYAGYLALTQGRNEEAIRYYEKALKIEDQDEMIFYNFATAVFKAGQYQRADSLLKKGLELNPDFEPILMYLGNIARAQSRNDDAMVYYERVIEANRKYFEAYVDLAELFTKRNVIKARRLLMTCLDMNPGYKLAIRALGDTYKVSNPDIARKYYDLADTIK
ncbi:MAG TPA: tetratricopeptide repeat protein [Bacteroidales bacterium]|nr:tetratricopeptide repeat protein [Bacteroidales bacterium]